MALSQPGQTATAPAGNEDVWVRTSCEMCHNSCAVQVRRVDGVVVKIEGIPEAPPNFGKICAKGNSGLMSLYGPGRLTQPLRRRNPEKGRDVDPQWEPISWDEALAILTRELDRVLQEDPRKLIAATFDVKVMQLLRLFMSAFGSPNVTTGPAGYFCGNAVHPISYAFSGSFDMHPDLKYAKHAIFFGASNGFVANNNAMPQTTELARSRAAGLKLVVIDPHLSNAAAQADEWVPIRPGTDAALAMGMMHVMVYELDRFDRAFVQRYTNGPYLIGEDGLYVREEASGKPQVWDTAANRACPYDAAAAAPLALTGNFTVQGRRVRPAFTALVDALAGYTPERVAEITTVPAATTRHLAREFVEAAQIGSTIVIDGVELPYRPACVSWYRGISAHKHGMLNGMALGVLNALVGAWDVPGGMLQATAAGPWGSFPTDGADGMLTSGNKLWHIPPTYPPKPVRPPETAELQELFPVSVYARAMLWLGVLYHEKFKLPYQPDTLIVCRTNLMTNTGDPVIMGEALAKLRFICAFADHHNETTQYADLVLPDTHYLERLTPLGANLLDANCSPVPGGSWTVNIQQPVVPPVGESRHWMAVLFEVAGRLGLNPELYKMINGLFTSVAHLAGDDLLDPERQYSWEEFCDRWIKLWTGSADQGLDYLKQQGYHVVGPRSVRDTFPRPFHKGRVPVYFEHFIRAGQQVRAVTAELGIDDWDTADYQPVPEWKPGPAYDRTAQPEYDLYAVNHKLTFLTFSFTAENRFLIDLAHRSERVYNVAMNVATARRKGLRDGEDVWLETPEGRRARGVLRTTVGLHPECLSIPGVLGRWITANPRALGQGVHFNSLIRYSLDRMDTVSAALDACVRVKVTRA